MNKYSDLTTLESKENMLNKQHSTENNEHKCFYQNFWVR